jgi:hypothetical protein
MSSISAEGSLWAGSVECQRRKEGILRANPQRTELLPVAQFYWCWVAVPRNVNVPDRALSGYSYGMNGRDSIPDKGKVFFSSFVASRPALGPTQPPIHWVLRPLSPGRQSERGVKLITDLHLPPKYHTSSWRGT